MTLEERAKDLQARLHHSDWPEALGLIFLALQAVDAEARAEERETIIKTLYEISESKTGLFKMTIQMAADRIQKGELHRDP